MTEPITIPIDRLSPEALSGVIEEFITREGTDYGHSEATFEDKERAIRRQLERGDALVVFDPETETTTLLLKRTLSRR